MAFPEYPGAIAYPEPWGEAYDRAGTDIDTLVVHCAVGSFPGFMQYLQRTPDVSCHYGVARDGRIGQGVSEQYGAFHAGTKHWNLRSIGIEHEDHGNCVKKPWMTEKQFAASTKLAAHLCEKYGIGPERVIPHRDVASDGRSCPGPYFDLVAYRDHVSRLLSPSKPPSKPVLYRVVAGTFKARRGANRRVSELKSKGFEAALVYEAGYFRVLAGSFKNRSGANRRVKALKAKNLEAYILPASLVPDAPKESSMQKAISYALELEKYKPVYKWWHEGDDCRKPGFWGAAGPAPPANTVKAMFCAGLINLMLRRIGNSPPKNGGIYDGGTRSYMLGYRNVMKPFKLSECRRGDVAFRDFQTGGYSDQGHIGLCLGGADDPILQSFSNGYPSVEPGLNKDWTLRESHAGWFYKWRIPREAIWG